MMTRVMTEQDLRVGWVVVEDGIYRCSVAQPGAILGDRGLLARSSVTCACPASRVKLRPTLARRHTLLRAARGWNSGPPRGGRPDGRRRAGRRCRRVAERTSTATGVRKRVES